MTFCEVLSEHKTLALFERINWLFRNKKACMVCWKPTAGLWQENNESADYKVDHRRTALQGSGHLQELAGLSFRASCQMSVCECVMDWVVLRWPSLHVQSKYLQVFPCAEGICVITDPKTRKNIPFVSAVQWRSRLFVVTPKCFNHKSFSTTVLAEIGLFVILKKNKRCNP